MSNQMVYAVFIDACLRLYDKVCWPVGLSVGRSVGRSVCRSVCRSVGLSIGPQITLIYRSEGLAYRLWEKK